MTCDEAVETVLATLPKVRRGRREHLLLAGQSVLVLAAALALAWWWLLTGNQVLYGVTLLLAAVNVHLAGKNAWWAWKCHRLVRAGELVLRLGGAGGRGR